MCREYFKNISYIKSFSDLDLLKSSLACICVSWLIVFLTELHYHLVLTLHIRKICICSVFCQTSRCYVQLWNQQDHKLLEVFLLYLAICYKTSRNAIASETSVFLPH